MAKIRHIRISSSDGKKRGLYKTHDLAADAADFLEVGYNQIDSDDVYEMPMPPKEELGIIFKSINN